MILQHLERPTPTRDPAVTHSIQTVTPPQVLLIYIQRARPDGTVCTRAILYGESLTYGGVQYGLRGALHYHPGSTGHYTSTVCRGDCYYNCNDTRIQPLTTVEALSVYGTHGSPNRVQVLMYAKVYA